MNSFSLGNKQKSLGARTMHLITCQLKHWLSSKMPAFNNHVTHRIRHSHSCCMANGWLEDKERQFFYIEIRALEKCRTKCISVAETILKNDKIWCPYHAVNCQCTNFLNAPRKYKYANMKSVNNIHLSGGHLCNADAKRMLLALCHDCLREC